MYKIKILRTALCVLFAVLMCTTAVFAEADGVWFDGTNLLEKDVSNATFDKNTNVLTLSGVKIASDNDTSSKGRIFLNRNSSSSYTLAFTGTNTMNAYIGDQPAIMLNNGRTLNIKGTGTLEATTNKDQIGSVIQAIYDDELKNSINMYSGNVTLIQKSGSDDGVALNGKLDFYGGVIIIQSVNKVSNDTITLHCNAKVTTSENCDGSSSTTTTKNNGYSEGNWNNIKYLKIQSLGNIVTFDTNGHGTSPDSATIDAGEKLSSLPTLTEDGYSFDGWFTDNGTWKNQWTLNYPIPGNLTLYAKWTNNTEFDVTFIDYVNTYLPQKYHSGTKVVKPSDPTRQNYTFDGWFKEETLTTKWNFDTDTVSANLTLYAKWTENAKFDVTFIDYVNTNVTQQYHSGEKVVKPSDPTRQNYTFDGWFKDKQLTTKWNFDTDTVSENLTLYAKWTEKVQNVCVLPTFSFVQNLMPVSVTLDTTGGKPLPQLNTYGGATIDLTKIIPERDGYTFEGWYADYKLEKPLTTLTVNRNTTVYAGWISNGAASKPASGILPGKIKP